MFRFVACSLLFVFVVACGDNQPGVGDDVIDGPQCSDGIDNDGDGMTDFPEDLGCESSIDESEDSPTLPKCSDGRDNDGDGKVDFPNDPGCLSPQEDDESDDCPDGPGCPACSNGRDDDLSGAMDFPADPGCESAGDPTEFTENPVACGAGMTISLLPPSGVATGTLDGTSTSMLTTTCGGGSGSSAHAYALLLTEPKIVVASTVDPMTAVDTVIDIRRANCSDPTAGVACNDDVRPGEAASELSVNLDPGVYYVIVEGVNSSATGPYQLTVNQFSGEGAACTMQSDCGPGLVCRPFNGLALVCAKPVCSDGVDDDGDGKTDFPDDPGCESPADGDELDDCPSGPNCPACSNGVDDDGDNAIDFGGDPGCTSAGSPIEGCGTEQDPMIGITGPTTTGTTVGAHDDFESDCGGTGGLDVQLTLTLPAMRSLSIDTVGSAFDTVVALRPSTCSTEIDCDDDGEAPQSALDLDELAAGLYVVAVDGFNTDDSGSFTLNVAGVIAVGGSCESPLVASGALTCEAGSTCDGTLGSRTCQTQCSDGIDNNGDGTIDFPNDPGCASALDNLEDTVCPGAMCPPCSDGIDNDGDGKIDFGTGATNDSSCDSAADREEDCEVTEPVAAIVTPVTAGTTVGATDDAQPTCGSGNAPDLVYSLDLPALESLTLVAVPESGFDLDLVVHDSTCGPSEIVCRDSSVGTETATLTNVAAGRYFVAIDGDATSEVGSFALTTSGVIAPGGSCESPLFTSGVLTCGQGLPCTGTPGSRTCSSQCSDGVDNDGDGKIDFPDEPGCTSIADDSEDDNCPDGPGCPQCSDGVDNDGDGDTDFGQDADCLAASTALEGSQCFQTDNVVDIVSFFTNGTTTGQHDDIDLSCGSSSGTGPDLAMRLVLPNMRSVSLDLLLSSGFDSVHALLTQQCTQPELICRDPADLDFGPLAAGTYFVVVDGFSATSNGVFTLLTSGQIEAGGSCEGALFASGALTCADNLPCQGAPGSRICFSECSDGVDNNGDGAIDFPADPGCTSAADAVEDTVCPGASCPACANGSDDDGDGLVDFPDDFACVSASQTTEVFCPIEANLGPPISQPTTTGTLDGTVADNFEESCQSNTGPEVTFPLVLPVPVKQLQVDTNGSTISDTVLSIKNASCSAQLGCDDDAGTGNLSLLTLSNVAAGAYAINVDSFGSSTGAFTLHVKGTVAPGTACTSPLFAAGVLVCQTGTTCNGTVCQ